MLMLKEGLSVLIKKMILHFFFFGQCTNHYADAQFIIEEASFVHLHAVCNIDKLITKSKLPILI